MVVPGEPAAAWWIYHPGVPAQTDLLTEAARRAARRFGDRAAFATPEGWCLSFAELDRAADQIAAGLRARGLGPGSTVALVLDSGVDYTALYLAAARIGAVTAGINPAASAAEATGCLQTVGPDLIAVHRHLVGLIPVGSAPLIEPLAPAAGPGSVGGGLLTGSDPTKREFGSGPDGSAVPDDPSRGGGPGPDTGERAVCICFTSGSTGAPKAAWFGDRQIRAIAAIDASGSWGGMGRERRDSPPDNASDADPCGSWGGGGHGLAITPMAHVGFMTKLAWLLDGGQTAHLLGRWSAGRALEAIAEHRMPAVTGVAPQIALMVRHRLIDQLDFSAVKAVIAGGGPSAPDLVLAARRAFGAGYSIRYSSTESGGVGLATALDADDEACRSIGRPRPGVEAAVRGADGSELAPGRVGELWLRSPTVMSGYWGDPAATADALADGWLRTGDLASVDERGLYRLAGRLDEMYIRGGYNVYPLEVENALGGHPGVDEVAVMGRPDPVMGQTGLAVVVPAEGSEPPTLENLRAFGASRLARHKLPEAVVVAAELPRRPNGKLDRVRLAEQWG